MCQTHHADCLTLGLAGVGGAHDFGRRARHLSAGMARSIDPKNGRKRRALSRGAAGSPRARRGLALNLPFFAALCPTLVDAGEAQQRPQQQQQRPQRPQRGGSVASGSRSRRGRSRLRRASAPRTEKKWPLRACTKHGNGYFRGYPRVVPRSGYYIDGVQRKKLLVAMNFNFTISPLTQIVSPPGHA